MPKKDGVPKSRRKKKVLENQCGCYYCCGDIDNEHRKRQLKIPKHKPKNWLSDDDIENMEIDA